MLRLVGIEITQRTCFREVNAIPYDQESVKPKHSKAERSNPKHLRKKENQPKHLREESSKPKVLKALIAAELAAVILACFSIYRIGFHNIEMRFFAQACSATLTSAATCMDKGTDKVIKTYMEGTAEEVYEYMWTTGKVKYRTGAATSYKSAGTLGKDKMVRRTAIMNNGWSRITIDDKDYYIPYGKLSADIPEGLPIADGIKGEYQKYALSLLPDFGWDAWELEPLIYLWNRESGWNPNSHNKRSGAHGIPQALPARKMASEGSDYYTNPEPQIRWGLKYIASRYGSPSAAWAHFQSSGWY